MKLTKVFIADKVKSYYQRLGKDFERRMTAKMELLMADPFNTALQIELTDMKPTRRMRVGEHRVFFRYDFPNETILSRK